MLDSGYGVHPRKYVFLEEEKYIYTEHYKCDRSSPFFRYSDRIRKTKKCTENEDILRRNIDQIAKIISKKVREKIEWNVENRREENPTENSGDQDIDEYRSKRDHPKVIDQDGETPEGGTYTQREEWKPWRRESSLCPEILKRFSKDKYPCRGSEWESESSIIEGCERIIESQYQCCTNKSRNTRYPSSIFDDRIGENSHDRSP